MLPCCGETLRYNRLKTGIAPGTKSLAALFTGCCHPISAPRTFAGEMKSNVRHAARIGSGAENQQGNRRWNPQYRRNAVWFCEALFAFGAGHPVAMEDSEPWPKPRCVDGRVCDLRPA